MAQFYWALTALGWINVAVKNLQELIWVWSVLLWYILVCIPGILLLWQGKKKGLRTNKKRCIEAPAVIWLIWELQLQPYIQKHILASWKEMLETLRSAGKVFCEHNGEGISYENHSCSYKFQYNVNCKRWWIQYFS